MQRIYLLILLALAPFLKSIAGEPLLQIVNLSSDPFLGLAKVELNDSVLVDTLRFNEGTAYITVPEGADQTLRFTALTDTSSKLEIAGLNIEADKLYQSILYGVRDDTDYTPNPDGESLLVNATFVEVDTSGIDENKVRANFFHSVGDAVQVDVADLIFEFIVNDMSFGQYSSNTTDLPADLRSIFFTSTDSVVTIASRSIDLGDVVGNTVTIFLSGFIIPDENEFGPVIGFYGIDAAGNTTEMSLALSTPLDEILSQLNIYPNPASKRLHLDFSSEESQYIELFLTDLNGRSVMQKTLQVNPGFNRHGIDLPNIPNGLYILSLTDQRDRMAVPLLIFK